ncbi:YHS domain-containing protein [bacterium]|nr:YHS domain-containing protein [bacterium]
MTPHDPRPSTIDPILLTVCGRQISGDPRYYPQVDHQGRRLYFCAETCLDVFLRDPERFLSAHAPKQKEEK